MRKILILLLTIAPFFGFTQGAFDYVATASGTDTYTATILVPTFPSSYTGVEIRITFTNANTGASTINITRSTGAVGAAAIRKWDGDSFEPLVSGDIPAGGQITLRYTGSYFIMDSFGKGSGSPLTSGNGTTANGTAVDLGGAASENIIINVATGKYAQIVSADGGAFTVNDSFTAAGQAVVLTSNSTAGFTFNSNSTGSALFGLPGGSLNIGGGSSNAGTLKFLEDSDLGGNYSSFKVGSQAGDIDYTLPTAAPTVNGQVLSSLTNGTMSWATPSGGTITDGSGTTANGTAVDIGGAATANTTFTGNFNWTWNSSGSRMGNFRVWSNGTVGLDGSTTSFLQTGTNVVSTTTSGVAVVTTGPLLLNTDAGTLGQNFTSNGAGSAPTWQNPKLASIDKTASFVAAIAEAGIYHYNITPASATTITFPSLTGQDGLQWAFWKNVDADAVVFNFGAETYNGATVLPDTSWVYVNWSDGRFKVAGTNPAAAGGGGTWGSITGTLSAQTDLQTALNGKQSTITFGTGVQTALGVNVGSAGAPVLFNGAGGTPSSLTGTNITGIPQSGVTSLTSDLALKQPLDGTLTNLAALASLGTANQLIATNSGVTAFEYVSTSTGSAVTVTDGTYIDFSLSGSPTTGAVNAFNITGDITGQIPVDKGGTGFDNTTQTYTPTLTNTANLAASTAAQCTYYRIGNAVTVAGTVTIDPTTTLTLTTLGISLPVASNFSTALQAGGTAAATAVADGSAGIISDATNDRVILQYVCTDVTNHVMSFSFTYQVL